MRKLAAVLAAVVVLAVGCSGADDVGDGDTAGGAGSSGVESRERGTAIGYSAEQAGAGAGAEALADQAARAPGAGGVYVGSAAALPKLGPSVIKTAQIDVELERAAFQDSMQSAVAIAARFGGFVLSSSTEGERARRGELIMRIPSASFERAMGAIKDLGNVEREQVTGEDVSQEFVDLEARLRNLSVQERVLLRLMGRAKTVGGTIQVQRELTGIQLEIERIRGRLRYLEDQTAFGTISIGLFEEGVVKGEGRTGVLQRAWGRAIDLFFGLVSAVIVASGVVVPIAVVAALLLIVFRRRVRTA